MVGFLLDVHIALDVVDAFHRLVPEGEIYHLSRWRNGSLRTAADEDILIADGGAGLVLVTFDVRTIKPLADARIAAGHMFPGVVLVAGSAAAASDVGGIARGLARVYAAPALIDPDYPVVYVRVT